MNKLKSTIGILIVLLIPFIIPSLSNGKMLPNLFLPDTKVTVPTEIDPWVVFAEWKKIDVYTCPVKDPFDFHVVYKNPKPNAEIKTIEIVLIAGGFLPYGTICSYSYMKDGKWHAFWQPDPSGGFVRWDGKEGEFHGGYSFGKGVGAEELK